MASPVFTEGVAAHVTHSYQPSKRVIRLSFEGTPPWVILWEAGGRRQATDIPVESLGRHMTTGHLMWIRGSLIEADALVGSRPVKHISPLLLQNGLIVLISQTWSCEIFFLL